MGSALGSGEHPGRGNLRDRGGQRPLIDFCEVAAAEQGLAGRDGATGLVGAVHERGDLLGQRALAEPGGGPLGALPHQFLDLLA